MRVLLQRVSNARVLIAGQCCAQIGKGLVALVGVAEDDGRPDAETLAKKTMALRIFSDEYGKMNRSVRDVGGAVLSVSQFTLYADTRHGNRPGFERAAGPVAAQTLWEHFNAALVAGGIAVQCGIFGAPMAVELCNDGPVTIGLESRPERGG